MAFFNSQGSPGLSPAPDLLVLRFSNASAARCAGFLQATTRLVFATTNAKATDPIVFARAAEEDRTFFGWLRWLSRVKRLNPSRRRFCGVFPRYTSHMATPFRSLPAHVPFRRR